jgi:hypothetical protein
MKSVKKTLLLLLDIIFKILLISILIILIINIEPVPLVKAWEIPLYILFPIQSVGDVFMATFLFYGVFQFLDFQTLQVYHVVTVFNEDDLLNAGFVKIQGVYYEIVVDVLNNKLDIVHRLGDKIKLAPQSDYFLIEAKPVETSECYKVKVLCIKYDKDSVLQLSRRVTLTEYNTSSRFVRIFISCCLWYIFYKGHIYFGAGTDD